MSDTSVAQAIMNFFGELDARGVRYAVLRKAERIPDEVGNDIDVLIDERDRSSVRAALGAVAAASGFGVYERKDVRGLYAILYRFVRGELAFFRLDFANPVRDAGALLEKRTRNERGIYQLPVGAHEKRKVRNLKRLLTYPVRMLFPPGKFVVLVGPDGVGKSTAAELAVKLLEAFHIPVAHMHLGFRPGMLPTRKAVLSLGREKRSAPGEESKVPGLMRFFYHAADYVLGYWFKIRPLLVKGKFVIGERYYYNYLVDPRREKELKFPLWLPRLVYALMIPKPDTVMLLSNEPAEIYRRRQEHPVGEIARQLGEYRAIGRRAKEFFEVRTDKPAEEVAVEMVNKLTGDE